MANLYILYGSATGNAEGIAKDLAEKPLPSHFSSVVCKPLNDFKKLAVDWEKEPEHGRKHGLILVSSTTGNGDAPENASRFVRFIKRKQTAEMQPFQHCAVAVLGLGDTNYDQFCEMGKLIDKKVVELGAERAMPLACADEGTGLEDVVEPWLDTVFVKVAAACMAEPELLGEEEESTQAEVEKVISCTPNDVEKVLPSQSDSPLFIMYGSATGNSEQIAKDLAASYEALLNNPDAHTFFPSVVCCELNQFKKHLPTWENENAGGSKHGLLIVASTTGNADAPENCTRFIRFIKRKQTVESQPFQNVCFAVLGLGDSNYDVFCATGKEIDKKLPVLGGTSAKALACADEGTGLEDVVDPWTISVLSDISNACRGGPPQNLSVSSAIPVSPSIKDEEEKKSESICETIVDSSPGGPGVALVKGMLDMSENDTIAEVSPTLLPSLGASRSSCEICPDDVVMGPRSRAASQGNDILYSQMNPYDSQIIGARYLTQTHFEAATSIENTRGSLESSFPLDGPDSATNERNGKRVIEVTLSLPNEYKYQPGDTIGLVVPNDAGAVEFMLELLRNSHGMLSSQKISIDEGHPVTLKQALEETVDLCCTLKNKKIINGLSQFASNQQEAATLRLLASKNDDGLRLYQEYIIDQRRSFVDILKDFPSCQTITIEGILALLPGIPPRYYSISSSPLESRSKKSLSIAFSVVDYLTPSLLVKGDEQGRRRIHGLATSYLESICVALLGNSSDSTATVPRVNIFPKPTEHFLLPPSLSTPIIIIGPGTGIAPFMGFLAHRKEQGSSNRTNEDDAAPTIGDIDVFFGCRHEDHDWLYKDEMLNFTSSRLITSLHTAFSRGVEKHYVQDLMKEPGTSKRLAELIFTKNGMVYICGDGNSMARDVQKAFAEILGVQDDGTVNIEKGRDELSKLKTEGRFLLDIWS